jgi:chorismate synthase
MVAAGAVAKKWLKEQFGTTFVGCMSQIGDMPIGFESWDHVPNNPFFAPVADVSALEDYMNALRKSGDSCGARLRVVARGVPVGLGQPLFDKIDADIAYAMMGINAVKGVEIGAGFGCVTQKGSSAGDALTPEGFMGNNAGGVLGGISTGQDIEVSIAVKPTSSILIARESIDSSGHPTEVLTKGRHDPCVGIRATPIAEAMLALVVMEHALQHRAQCGDVAHDLPPIAAAKP